ncbi:MAG: hypothetical protein D6797_04900, partial [Bdellovibrio sp.]
RVSFKNVFVTVLSSIQGLNRVGGVAGFIKAGDIQNALVHNEDLFGSSIVISLSPSSSEPVLIGGILGEGNLKVISKTYFTQTISRSSSQVGEQKIKSSALASIVPLLNRSIWFQRDPLIEPEFTWQPRFCSLNKQQAIGFADGDGSAEHPYVICSPHQFHLISKLIENDTGLSTSQRRGWANMHYVLLNDLDMKYYDGSSPAKTLHPIGTYSSGSTTGKLPFQGTFDGKRYKISNVILKTSSSGTNWGLFRYVVVSKIINVNLQNVWVEAKGINEVGALSGGGFVGFLGYNSVTGGKVIGKSTVGGLFGTAFFKVRDSYSKDLVVQSLTDVAGGVVGQSSQSLYRVFSINGQVSAANYAGGIIGKGTGFLRDAYSSNKVTVGTDFVGGLAAQWGYSNTNTTAANNHVENVYFSGILTGGKHQGGLFAKAFLTSMKNSYSLANINDSLSSSGGAWAIVDDISSAQNVWAIDAQNSSKEPGVQYSSSTITVRKKATGVTQTTPLWPFGTVWKNFDPSKEDPVFLWQ